jgi:LSD1 subclass zinc finger protein
MTKNRKIVIKQINLQEKIQQVLGINIVTCGSCGTVLLHEKKAKKIKCFCGAKMDLSDCPDLYYSGLENNEEFL